MGYALNELANLPIDENVRFYIFVVNGQFREPFYEMVQENFISIAKSIGNNAVITVGTDPKAFTTSVARKYLGVGNSDNSFLGALPAMLITNAHPEQLTKDSVRLVVPLRDAEKRFGSWAQFFTLLSSYVRGESDEFLKRFEAGENLLDAANKVIGLKPGMFGISVNINELINLWSKRRAKSAG
jgi:hypothetical protein